MKSDLLIKCKKIRIVLTDVDGVLTDGGMYYSQKGDVLKKFYVRDGMGVTLLRKNNIHTIIVTKEKNETIRQWSSRMKIKKLYDGVVDKETIVLKVCKYFGVTPKQIAYIGDDVNDIGLLKKVGLSATPNDGIKEVKSICDYICKNDGGKGAFRELVDLILLTQKIIGK